MYAQKALRTPGQLYCHKFPLAILSKPKSCRCVFARFIIFAFEPVSMLVPKDVQYVRAEDSVNGNTMYPFFQNREVV